MTNVILIAYFNCLRIHYYINSLVGVKFLTRLIQHLCITLRLIKMGWLEEQEN